MAYRGAGEEHTMRLILGIILGGALVVGGSILMGSLLEAWGIKQEATFADGCLAVIIILLSILLVRGVGNRSRKRDQDTFRKW